MRYLLSWKICGEAGFGIKSAGATFAHVANRAGYEVFGYVEYPSLIRGGLNTYQVTVSEKPRYSAAQNIDLLVSLNREGIIKNIRNLEHGAAIVYDNDEAQFRLGVRERERNIKLVHVPLAAITKEVGGTRIIRNTIALGASQAVLGLPLQLLLTFIRRTFVHKKNIVDVNLKAATRGYQYVKTNHRNLDFKINLKVVRALEELLVSGNEALAMGALAGGLQFYAAYPMTPSTSILHYLASKASSQRLVVKHAEDEISVVNMAIGASHAGARSMVATSGGGFSLMVESLGLAGITETPLVIVEVMRPGPATGLPTWTEQGDLRFVMHAAQGEFPRIVLAPGDHEECFFMAAEALNLADRYQTPVIILSDKYLGESDRTVRPFDIRRIRVDRGRAVVGSRTIKAQKEYRRYRSTDNGISLRSIPGQRGGIYIANSDEHDEYGFTSEDADNRGAQARKRAAKFDCAATHVNGANLYGNPRAKVTVVGWGSTKGPILDAISWLPDRLKRKVNFLHFNVLWPFPSGKVYAVLSKSRKILLVENNATAQLGGLIRQQTGIYIHHKLLRYDGRPIYPADIKERIMVL